MEIWNSDKIRLANTAGEQAHDLPFRTGDQLTIIEPCNVVFWYLAESEQGRRGVIPINFVQVEWILNTI